MRLGKEIDNHVRDNLNEKSNTFPTTTIDGFRESKENKLTIIVTISPPKTTPTPPMQVKKLVAHFPNRLNGKKD